MEMNDQLECPQIHVRIQQIYGRKKVTWVSGIEEYKEWIVGQNSDNSKEKEENKEKEGEIMKNYTNLEGLLSQLKKKFNCGGHIVKNENVITLQGEHSYNIKDVLMKY